MNFIKKYSQYLSLFAFLFTLTLLSITPHEASASTNIISTSPTNGAPSASLSQVLSITFDSPVNIGIGHVSIFTSNDDQLVEAIDVTSGQVTGAGSSTVYITPSNHFIPNVTYYVKVDPSAFTDSVGNSLSGINDKTTWSFATATTSSGKISISPNSTGFIIGTGPHAYTVMLDEPIISATGTAYLTINLTNTDPRLTLSTTTISYSASDWFTQKNFTVTVANDPSRHMQNIVPITFLANSNSEYYSGFHGTNYVTILDDDAAPTLTEISPIPTTTTIDNTSYHFRTSDTCSIVGYPIHAYLGDNVSLHVSSTTPSANTDVTAYLTGMKVGGKYSFSIGCTDLGGLSNTLTAGPFYIAPQISNTQSLGATAVSSDAVYTSAQTQTSTPTPATTATLNNTGATSLSSNLASTSTNQTLKSLKINLSFGMKNNSVTALQNFLVSKDADQTGTASKALAAHGITNYFGKLCKQALIEWQTSVGISPATGVFGPKSRSRI